MATRADITTPERMRQMLSGPARLAELAAIEEEEFQSRKKKRSTADAATQTDEVHISGGGAGPPSPFAHLYSSDGMMLVFRTTNQIRSVITHRLVLGLLEKYIGDVELPVEIELNLSWSVKGPRRHEKYGEGFDTCFQLGLLLQILGKVMGLVRCTYNHAVDTLSEIDELPANGLCKLSGAVTASITNPGRHPHLEEVLRDLGPLDLDGMALFPRPFLFSIACMGLSLQDYPPPFTFMEQWYNVCICTNCIAAGFPGLCTHHIATERRRFKGLPFATCRHHAGVRSELDQAFAPPPILDSCYQEMQASIYRNANPMMPQDTFLFWS